MPQLKVLHLITTLPRLSGAADSTRDTVNLLDPHRYNVHLAAGTSEWDVSRVAPHVRVIPVDSIVRPIRPAADLRAIAALYRLFRQERYDIVHTHNSKAGVLGRAAARLSGVPLIIHTAHTISFVASDRRLVNQLYRLADQVCARLSTKIVTVSQLNTATYLDAGVGRPEQYVTIYSGVESAKFGNRSERAPCRTELGISDDAILVVWIGRLNRQKDPITFLHAAKRLSDRLPNTWFVMVGEDSVGESLEPEVRATLHTLNLNQVVRLLGYRPDVHRLLAAADLVMHSSLYEGLGRSVIETMLSGVPIVATGVDGVREAVVSGERGGLLVPARDAAALADAAAQLLEDPRRAARLAAVGQAWARERFDVDLMVQRIDELYQTLWRDRASRAPG